MSLSLIQTVPAISAQVKAQIFFFQEISQGHYDFPPARRRGGMDFRVIISGDKADGTNYTPKRVSMPKILDTTL